MTIEVLTQIGSTNLTLLTNIETETGVINLIHLHTYRFNEQTSRKVLPAANRVSSDRALSMIQDQES